MFCLLHQTRYRTVEQQASLGVLRSQLLLGCPNTYHRQGIIAVLGAFMSVLVVIEVNNKVGLVRNCSLGPLRKNTRENG
jgi:hypothetical protein